MYKLKQIPEDFLVNEVSEISISKDGNYSYFSLEKKNYTTVSALEFLSKRFGIPLKFFGFAGNKDKNAITTQRISIFRGSRNFENSQLKDLKLTYLGNGKEPISLGDLDGNEFAITIRNLEKSEIGKLNDFKGGLFPNLFGPQRFSKNNHLVGKAIIKKDFKKAVELILENGGAMESQIRESLEKEKNNYIHALRLIPIKTRKLFVHAYQSFIFNRIAKEVIEGGVGENVEIPIIGFGFEIETIENKKIVPIFRKIIEEEKVSPRDFIISQMPELSSEGGKRSLYAELKNFKIMEISGDERNEKKQKCTVKFFLPKGSYATTAIEFIFS